MKPQISKTERQTGKLYIALSGQLVLKYHQELYLIFTSIDQEVDEVELHLDSPVNIDLCFLQMLMAFKNERIEAGRSVKVSASLQEADGNLLERTGFSALLNNAGYL